MWSKFVAWLKSWWSAIGKAEFKVLFSGLIGQLWKIYGKGILKIVKDIALGIALPQPGETKVDLFKRLLKELIDSDKDGKIQWDDIPESVINFLREWALNFWKNLGKDDEERAKKVAEIIKK